MDVFYENNTDLTNIIGERVQSNVEDEIMKEAESGSKVDSATAKEQRREGETMTMEESGEQSQGAVRGSTTPYVFLTLEELQALRETIKKSLKDLGEDKD